MRREKKLKRKKGFFGFVFSLILMVTLIGGCLTAYAGDEIIQHVDAHVTQTKATIFVAGLSEKEYGIKIFKGETLLGSTIFKGESRVMPIEVGSLEEAFVEDTVYTAKLYDTPRGEGTEIYSLNFNAGGGIIEHVRALVSKDFGEAFVSGLPQGTDPEDYYIEIYKEGERAPIGFEDEGVFNGVVPFSLESGQVFVKDVMYSAVLVKKNLDGPDEQVCVLKFNADGEMIEHVEAEVGKKEGKVYVSGLLQGNEYFVDVEKDGEVIGTTDPKITANGVATIALTEGTFEKDVIYTAKLYDGTSTDPQILLYELKFDAEEVNPKTADNSNTAFWIIIAAAAVVSITVAGKKFAKR